MYYKNNITRYKIVIDLKNCQLAKLCETPFRKKNEGIQCIYLQLKA